ncbi:MAG: hypothetical protein HXY28_01455 [Hydrogenophilaceae bacterium]|jgi:hypothetical protein|nr:hypothetical protein [Hydrogenophilaceae bacterium]
MVWRVLLTTALSCAAALTGCAGPAREGPPPLRGYFITPNGEPLAFGPGESAVARWFAAADADGDAAVTLPEYHADAERFFAAIDADSDGLATAPEVSALRARLAPQLEAMLAYLPAPGGRRPQGERLPRWTPEQGFIAARRGSQVELLTVVTLLNEREPVLASDADFNRRVSRAEFAAAGAERFALLDADRSGALTLPELEALRR